MKRAYYSLNIGFSVNMVDLMDVTRDRGFRYSFYKKGRPRNAFVYVVKGKLLYSFAKPEAKEMQLSAGELFFVSKGSEYGTTYLDDGTKILIIQFDFGENSITPSYLSAPTKIKIPAAGQLINSFFTLVQNNSVNHPFFLLSKMYDLLWQIDKNYSDVPVKFKKISRAVSELSAKFEENSDIAYYAEMSAMSVASFRRLFKEYTGKSPIEYRNDLRLESARVKLSSGEYNVTEAALSVGFSNLSFFTRLYKRKFGHNPKQE